ncbi:trypsin-like peptidase domain-containing protein [Aquihabitans sp. G128]|uniref:S1C family serine protease n=1 Tax=Aquihabitans sp. G128 TaxID=2849779 RepID=UPI001C216A24|nr:trypsin-like peptidase domain-containing protein [Aquihabitans sp. G128]QXC60440.1 trypsin-like peptidase domain-containing protein [Aquihabitans sp. G128]
MADDRRAPGAGSRPPTDWPAPKLAGPLPGEVERTRRSPALVGFLAFLLGALVVGAAFATYAFGDRRGRSGAEVATKGATTTQPRSTGPAAALDIRKILDIAQPSVVSITTGGADSIFGGAGSGVVISKDGLILTNAHVIESAGGNISVRFSDGQTSEATLVGASTTEDVALLQVQRSDLTPATLGSSANLLVGDNVVAIGNALALGDDPSVTSGIVSAKNRSINDGKISLDHLIQTDAAINPGNSGGPLVNAAGEVVGINTAIIQGSQNVGFSLAIDEVRKVVEDLKAGKGDLKPNTAVLGVATVTVDSSLSATVRDQFKVTATSGALVTAVEPDSAAADAGIEEGDVVVEAGGGPVSSNEQLTDLVRRKAPGDSLAVTVERQGRRRSFDVTLGPK